MMIKREKRIVEKKTKMLNVLSVIWEQSHSFSNPSYTAVSNDSKGTLDFHHPDGSGKTEKELYS